MHILTGSKYSSSWHSKSIQKRHISSRLGLSSSHIWIQGALVKVDLAATVQVSETKQFHTSTGIWNKQYSRKQVHKCLQYHLLSNFLTCAFVDFVLFAAFASSDVSFFSSSMGGGSGDMRRRYSCNMKISDISIFYIISGYMIFLIFHISSSIDDMQRRYFCNILIFYFFKNFGDMLILAIKKTMQKISLFSKYLLVHLSLLDLLNIKTLACLCCDSHLCQFTSSNLEVIIQLMIQHWTLVCTFKCITLCGNYELQKNQQWKNVISSGHFPLFNKKHFTFHSGPARKFPSSPSTSDIVVSCMIMRHRCFTW